MSSPSVSSVRARVWTRIRTLPRAASSALPSLPCLVALVWSVCLVIDANAYFTWPYPALLHPPDEGYASALARRMLEGHNLPYVDGVSHRGPLYYWSIAGAMKLTGTGTWLPVRALSFASMLLTVVVGYLAAALAGRSTSGAVMALIAAAVWLGDMPPMDGIGYNSEHLLNVFAMTALVCMVAAFRSREGRPRALWVASSGAATMLSALSKQVGLALAFPLGLWLLAVCFRSGDFRDRKAWTAAGAFASGLLAPLAAVVARYAAAHELGTLYYYTVTYNTEVYGGALRGAERLRVLHDSFIGRYDLLIFAAPVVGLACTLVFTPGARLAERLARYARHGFDNTVLLSFAVTLAASNASLRNFHHYYLQVVPWAGLAGGVLLERAGLSRGNLRPALTSMRRAGVLLPLALVAHLGWAFRLEAHRNDGTVQDRFQTQAWPICKFLRKKTTKNDSIFIWGFDPAPYTACDRRPASRYVYTTFVAGYVPFLDAPRRVEDQRVSPHAREILLDELRHERPAVIFDSPSTMGNRSILQYTAFKKFVTENYCKAKVKLGPTAWVKKPPEGCAK